MHRYSFFFLLTLIPLLQYSQSMQYCPISIEDSNYQIFDDPYGYFEEEIILIPVHKNDTSNVSSFQFNLTYNPNVINFENDYLSTVNSSLFYSTTNIEASSSDTNNGGVFAHNTFEITDSLSMITIVYATSNPEEINSTLLYIPISLLAEGCSNLNFTNGFQNTTYTNPNQIYGMMISNQDMSLCANNTTICFTCLDELCDEVNACIGTLDECGICNGDGPQIECWDGTFVCNQTDCTDPIYGCTDAVACNYCEDCLSDETQCIYPNECVDCETPQITQYISLNSGWSLMSTYICPYDSDISVVLTDITNDIIIVKDYSGNVYWPTFGINTIGNVTNGWGYQIKLYNNNDLVVTGKMLDYDYPIELPLSWFLIGYLHQEPYPIDEMVSAIVDNENLLIIKDQYGNVYWPSLGINSIELMSPGQGYQIKLIQNEETFFYPESENGRYNYDFDYYPPINQFNNPINTGNNMTLAIPEESWSNPPNIGDQIIAYDNSGLIVGYTLYSEKASAITIWGDDETTEEKDGVYIGEKFKLKLWDNEKNNLKDMNVLNWQQGSDNYSIDGISIAGQISQVEILNRQVIKITDIIGREIKENTKRSILFYIYNDGTIERKYLLK